MSQQPVSKTAKSAPLALSILAAVVVVAIILVMFYVGSRLQTIEDRLAFEPVQPNATTDTAVPLTSMGRSVYIPAYSHIYSRGGRAFLLEVTLSIRNTDPELPIRIDRVRYFDTAGGLVRELAAEPVTLGPLQTAAFLVEKTDVRGGSGANFIVEWKAKEAVNAPVMEAVMIGIGKDQNLSFTSRGVPVVRVAP
jgi:hypothetical protein